MLIYCRSTLITENLTVGKKIDVGDVISKATGLLKSRPEIMVPQIIVVVPMIIVNLLTTSPALVILRLPADIVFVVVGLLISGAYPLLVKETLDGHELAITEALRHAFRRFWSILAASILLVI